MCWLLVRNHMGQPVLATSIVERDVDNPKTFEALANYKSFKLYMYQGFTNIIIESDCLLVVDALLSMHAPTSSLKNIILDIRSLMSHFISCQVQHISQLYNNVAHR